MDYSKLYWHGDWMGEEVKLDEIQVVGLYSLKDFPDINMYVDIEKGKIIEVWLENEE